MNQSQLVAAFLALLLWWMWPIRLPRRRPSDALDEPVSELGGQVFTGRMLAEGLIACGGIGSGKTTCLAPLLVDMLRAGYAAALFTVKVEEVAHLERLVRLAGRESDLVRIGRGHPATIDAVAHTYASTRSIESVSQLFESLLTAIEGRGESSSDQKSRFFERSGLIAVRHATVLIACINPGNLSFGSIGAMISDAPTIRYINNPATAEERSHVAWFRQTNWWQSKEIAEARLAAGEVPAELVEDLGNAIAFFTGRWASLANDTRTSIVASVTAMSELFSFNPLHSLLAKSTTITPEGLWDGDRPRIFLFTDAVHEGIDRKLLQLTWKFLLIKAGERRDATKSKVKVAFWMDEAHQLMLSAGRLDSSWQAISRSKGFASVLLLQSLVQVKAILGDDEANDYISNIRNRVIMAVDEPWTQKWLSELIGKEMKFLPSPQPAPKEGGIDLWGANRQPAQFHSQMDYAIYPHEWGSLQKAKPGQLGEAILYLGGTPIRGKSHVRVWLRQLLD